MKMVHNFIHYLQLDKFCTIRKAYSEEYFRRACDSASLERFVPPLKVKLFLLLF